MNLYLSPIGAVVQFLTNLGVPLSGGLIHVYVGGSVSTPQTSYTDATATTLNSNPIVLNSAGRMVASNQPVSIWVPTNTPHKVVITDSAGNLLFGLDALYGINDPFSVLGLLATATSGSGADLVANAVRSFDLFVSMRAAAVPAPVSGQTLIVISEGGLAIGDLLAGQFYWSTTSTAADDGLNVIKPTAAGATGRYLRVQPLILPKYKAATTSRASTTTLVIDPDLQLQIPAAGVYLVELWLSTLGGTSAGGLAATLNFSAALAAPSFYSGIPGGTAPAIVQTTAISTGAAPTGVNFQPGNQLSDYSCWVAGILNASAAGTLGLWWAQVASSVTASLVAAGSWIKVTRIA